MRSIQPRALLRFSLRSLLVLVTSIAVWLGWNVHCVEERKAMRLWITEHGGFVNTYEGNIMTPNPTMPDWYVKQLAEISYVRSWFGDEPIFYINLVRAKADWEDRQRIAKMFPEASVVPERPTGFHPLKK